MLAAGAATPGGTGSCVGVPFWLDRDAPEGRPPGGGALAWIALVPGGLGYAAAAGRLRELRAAGLPVGAVLAAGDEGVLVANRVDAPLPVLDQVDLAAVAGCARLAVEVRPPGQPLTVLTDPVALAAALELGGREAGDAAVAARSLLDYSNAVIGVTGARGDGLSRADGSPAGGAPAAGPGGRGRAVGAGRGPPGPAPSRLRRAVRLAGGAGHRVRHRHRAAGSR